MKVFYDTFFLYVIFLIIGNRWSGRIAGFVLVLRQAQPPRQDFDVRSSERVTQSAAFTVHKQDDADCKSAPAGSGGQQCFRYKVLRKLSASGCRVLQNIGLLRYRMLHII